jgi:hypothetical protein
VDERERGGPTHQMKEIFLFKCEVSKLYVRTHVRESVRREERAYEWRKGGRGVHVREKWREYVPATLQKDM